VHEQGPRCRGWSTPLAVVGKNLADIGRHGQAVAAAALASHRQFAGAPFDVVETQAGHFAGPKPQTRQRSQHREIASPDRGVRIAGREQPVHLLRGQRS